MTMKLSLLSRTLSQTGRWIHWQGLRACSVVLSTGMGAGARVSFRSSRFMIMTVRFVTSMTMFMMRVMLGGYRDLRGCCYGRMSRVMSKSFRILIRIYLTAVWRLMELDGLGCLSSAIIGRRRYHGNDALFGSGRTRRGFDTID